MGGTLRRAAFLLAGICLWMTFGLTMAASNSLLAWRHLSS